MLLKLSTDKTVSAAAVLANHFGVMQVRNLKETMTKKGVESKAAAMERMPGYIRQDYFRQY